MFPWEWVDCLFATKGECVGLIVCAISFQDFQPIWSQSTNVTDRQTDGRKTCDHKTALCTKVHCMEKTKKIMDEHLKQAERNNLIKMELIQGLASSSDTWPGGRLTISIQIKLRHVINDYVCWKGMFTIHFDSFTKTTTTAKLQHRLLRLA